MKNETIIITESDRAKLEDMIAFKSDLSPRDRCEFRALENELKRAKIVAAGDVPPDVITMHSRAELLDLETGERMAFTVVFPEEADIEEGRISVLAPVGTAMLGYCVGDAFEMPTPSGVRRLIVAGITFQPEAAVAAMA
jgi:regulator of nucleoside diphosphate kinase